MEECNRCCADHVVNRHYRSRYWNFLMTLSQIDRGAYESPAHSHARRYAEDKLAA
jgi:hypothetical protein